MTLAFIDALDGRVYADKALTCGVETSSHRCRPQKFYDVGSGRIATYGGGAAIGDWAIRNLRRLTPRDHFDDLKNPVHDYPEAKSEALEGLVATRVGGFLVVQEFGKDWIEAPYLVKIGAKIGWFVGCGGREADALYRSGCEIGKIFEICNEIYPAFVSADYWSVTIPEIQGKIPPVLKLRLDTEEMAG